MMNSNYTKVLFMLTNYKETFVKSEGTIKETIQGPNNGPLKTSYLIQSPNRTITTIRIIQLRFENCNDATKCCKSNFLLIGNRTNNSKFCSNTTSNRTSITNTNIEVTLQVERGTAHLWLEYKTRNATECPNHEYQCVDKLDCFNTSQICDNKFACKDHSDEIGCPYCAQHLTPCDSWSTICFNPETQRCDGVLDCPRAEDELGCSKRCDSTTIECLDSKKLKCINQSQVCDKKEDCPSGYDERNCFRQFCEPPSYFLCNNGLCIDENLVGNGKDDCGDLSDEMDLLQVIKTCTLALFILLLIITFTGLIVRWCTTRRDIHRLLQNLPEFPLPPFQGPGDGEQQECYQLGYSDSDFRVGGDIYEAFVRSRRRIDDNNRKNGSGDAVSTTTHSGSSNGANEESELDIIKAIVSLSLPHAMCIGLDNYFKDLMEQNQPSTSRSRMKFGTCRSGRKTQMEV